MLLLAYLLSMLSSVCQLGLLHVIWTLSAQSLSAIKLQKAKRQLGAEHLAPRIPNRTKGSR